LKRGVERHEARLSPDGNNDIITRATATNMYGAISTHRLVIINHNNKRRSTKSILEVEAESADTKLTFPSMVKLKLIKVVYSMK